MKRIIKILLLVLLVCGLLQGALLAIATQAQEYSTQVMFKSTGLAITGITEDCTVKVGDDLQLQVAVTGLLPFEFLWEVSTDNGAVFSPLTGTDATAAACTVTSLQANTPATQPYIFRVTVTDGGGYTVSREVKVLVSDDYAYRTVSLRSGDTDVSSYMHEETRLVVTPVEESSPAVTELEQEMAADGLPLLICDVKLVNQNDEVVPYFGAIVVDFHVGAEYNGMTLKAHHLHDNVIDTYSGVVADGILSITVNSLSPFLIEVPDDTVHTITASAGANGSISPSGTVNVADGASKTFTFLPAAGYAIDTVLLNNAPVSFTGNSYTLAAVTADAAISVSFRAVMPAAELHTITVTSGAHGSVSPYGTVQVHHGEPQTFYFYPDSGYELDVLLVNGQEVNVLSSSYTLAAVEADATVQASFRQAASQPPDVYKVISASSGAGGRISPAGEVSVEYGGEMYFYFIPDEGYAVAEVTVDGAVTAVAGSSYQFVNVVDAHTINVTFRQEAPPPVTYYTISAGVAGEGGSISPTGEVSVAAGSSQKFVFTPDAGYEVDSVQVDGLAVAVTYENAAAGSGGTAGDLGTAAGSLGIAWYEFTNVADNHSIKVSFKESGAPPPVLYTITASAGAGGSISPAGSVQVVAGGSQSFLFVPDDGYEVDTVTVDGTAVDLTVAGASYVFSAVTADHTIHVSFKEEVTPPQPVFYTIAASAGAGGSISPPGEVSVAAGGSQTFYFIAAENYEVAAVTVDGTELDLTAAGTSYTFSAVAADHTIHVTFKEKVTPPPVLYTITASAGAGGSISPAGAVQVAAGGSQVFCFVPDDGYEVAEVKVDGTALDLSGAAGTAGGAAGAAGSGLSDSGTTYTFSNVSANHTIHVSFREKVVPPLMYTITASAGTGGSISPAGAVQVAEGATQTFNFLPDAGYEVDAVIVDSAAVSVSGTSYQFSNVTANHVIMVSFKKTVTPPEPVVYYTIKASAGAGGSISPTGAVQVAEGESQTFYFAAAAGYEVNYVRVDGKKVALTAAAGAAGSAGAAAAPGISGAAASYTFSNVAAAHTIRVTFKKSVTPPVPEVRYTIIACSGAHGYISPRGCVQVERGGSQTFYFMPDKGCEVAAVIVDGKLVSVSADTRSYEFADVRLGHRILVLFRPSAELPEPVEYYTIKADAGAHGSISPDGRVLVAAGGSQTFWFRPDKGYEVDEVIVDGEAVTVSGAAAAGAADSAEDKGALGSTEAKGAVSLTDVKGAGDSVDVKGTEGASWSADRGNCYQFTDVAANHRIKVTFRRIAAEPEPVARYTIAAESGKHGRVSPAGSVQVAAGASQTFYLLPDNGYEVDTLTVDGKTVQAAAVTGSAAYYRFTDVAADHSLQVTFKKSVKPHSRLTYYTVRASAGAHGCITPKGSVRLVKGSDVCFYIVPDYGYDVAEVLLDGKQAAVQSGAAQSAATQSGAAQSGAAQSAAQSSARASFYWLEDVAANHSLHVTFRKIEAAAQPVVYHKITASSDDNGAVSPSGEVWAADGGAQTFYFIPRSGFEVAAIYVDGQKQDVVSSCYTVDNITADVDLRVEFKRVGFLPGVYDGNCLWGHLFGGCIVCESVEHYLAPWCWLITLVPLASLGGAGWYWRRTRRK